MNGGILKITTKKMYDKDNNKDEQMNAFLGLFYILNYMSVLCITYTHMYILYDLSKNSNNNMNKDNKDDKNKNSVNNNDLLDKDGRNEECIESNQENQQLRNEMLYIKSESSSSKDTQTKENKQSNQQQVILI